MYGHTIWPEVEEAYVALGIKEMDSVTVCNHYDHSEYTGILIAATYVSYKTKIKNKIKSKVVVGFREVHLQITSDQKNMPIRINCPPMSKYKRSDNYLRIYPSRMVFTEKTRYRRC